MRFSNKELEYSRYSYVQLFYYFLHSFLIEYPSAYNITYFWNFGFLAAIFLIIQIISGIFLAMYYTPEVTLAFFSIDYIMRDVSSGWFLRYLHLNGASMFFICIYLHIFKGLYYRSYQSPRRFVWIIGIVIYICAMGTAFLGYVLPWGQMSYWAATVITNFVTVIPYVGSDIVEWLWGGFSINNATLSRFFSWHYILPFVIAGLVLVHLVVLHQYGSNNPTGFVAKQIDKVTFYPYSYIKDFFGLSIFFLFFVLIVFFFPETLNHSDNYVEANSLITPAHIVPEWYFLPFYAILRSIPDKTFGIIAMFLSILLFVVLPSLDVKSYVKSLMFKTIYRKIFWFILFNLVYLGFLGANSPISPYVELGLLGTHLHILYFIFIICILSFVEYEFIIIIPNYINTKIQILILIEYLNNIYTSICKDIQICVMFIRAYFKYAQIVFIKLLQFIQIHLKHIQNFLHKQIVFGTLLNSLRDYSDYKFIPQVSIIGKYLFIKYNSIKQFITTYIQHMDSDLDIYKKKFINLCIVLKKNIISISLNIWKRLNEILIQIKKKFTNLK